MPARAIGGRQRNALNPRCVSEVPQPARAQQERTKGCVAAAKGGPPGLDAAFEIEHDFLTGSYARWTKTKPLKDVDIFCALAEKHQQYRDQAPSVLLGDVEKALVKRYGGACVSQQRRSCTVDFGVTAVEDRTDYKVTLLSHIFSATAASEGLGNPVARAS